MAQQRQQGKELPGTAAATAGPPYRTLLEFVAWSVAEVQAHDSKTMPVPCADFLQRELPSVQDAARRVKVSICTCLVWEIDKHCFLGVQWGPVAAE